MELITQAVPASSAPKSETIALAIEQLVDVHALGPSEIIEVDDRRFQRHVNGGGLVEVTAFAAPTVFVGPFARIQDHALVLGKVEVRDSAIVGGHALVTDHCIISKQSRVGGRAVLREHVWMRHHAQVDGDAVLLGAITVEYTRRVCSGTYIGTMAIS